MKKLLILSAVLLGTVAASQAGVHVNLGIGLPFPRLPFPGRVIISHPAPFYVEPAPYCEPERVYVEPYCPPPRVVYVPEPRYYPPVYQSYQYGRGGYSSRPNYYEGRSTSHNYSGRSHHYDSHSNRDNRGGYCR